MHKIFLTVLLYCSFLSSMAVAQTGSITGTVTDEISGETIIGANVVLKGTTTGASTDLDGKFTISNLAPGSYDLQVSYVSYAPHTIPAVVVEAVKITTVNIALKENVSELQDVVVVGQRMISTDAVLLRTFQESSMVVTGISAELISKTQDSDAADVVKRVPGVTIMNDKFVVIRGLSQRYNVAMLHSAYAPSMEADIRSFAFDIVPSGQIDQILVYKSPSAELPGDFAGGTVKVFTKNVPDENSLSVGYSTGYRSNTHMQNFLIPERGQGYQSGFNTGFNDLPKGFPEDVRNVANDDIRLTQAGQSLENTWVPEAFNTFLDQSISLSGDLKFNLKNGWKLGNVTTLSYSDSKIAYPVTRNDYNQYDPVTGVKQFIYQFNDQQYNQNIKIGALFNWGLQAGKNHSFEFINLFNQVGGYQYINRTGRDLEFNYSPDNHSFQQSFRGVYSGQLAGKHSLFSNKTKIRWMAGYGLSYREMPDYRRYRTNIPDPTADDGTRVIYVPFGAAQTYFLGRFYSDMDETSQTGGIDLEQEISFGPKTLFKPVFMAGAFYEYKTREFDARNLGYVRANSSQFDPNLQLLPIDQFFAPQNINTTTGVKLDEQTNPNDAYDASNKLTAYYASLKIPFTLKLNLVAGVRIEDNLQQLNSALLGGEIVDKDYPLVRALPSFNLSYNFTKKMLVRAAYGETINRPEFREIAPFSFFDFDYNLVKVGNPNLQNATIKNLDLRWELYPSPTEIINVGLFYKKFLDPIETLFVPGSGTGGAKTFSFGNAESATSIGVEIDMRKSLTGLTQSAFINNLSLMLNAAFIKSNVQIGGTGSGRDSNDRPLYGQSPYIINTGLFYNNEKSRLQFSALYNVIGRRIFIIGFDTYPDIYEMPRNVLDLSVSKGIGEKLMVKLGVSDIINQEIMLLQDGNQDGTFDRKDDQIIQSYKPGMLWSLSVNYRIF
jgi:TonB-dependent receptor